MVEEITELLNHDRANRSANATTPFCPSGEITFYRLGALWRKIQRSTKCRSPRRIVRIRSVFTAKSCLSFRKS